MKFRQLTGSLIAASAILTSTLPAHAGPFDSAGGIFKPATTRDAATGNATSANSAPNTSNSPVGNGEIQGLGDHQSWVDNKVLAKDPRALCTDVGLGNNTSTNSSEIALANSNSTRSNSAQTHKDGGGGGGSFLGIVSVSGNGSTQGSKNNSNSSDRSTNSTEKKSSSSSTVVEGRNCDAFVNSAAARDMNYQDNLSKRYEVKTRERGNRVQTLLENK